MKNVFSNLKNSDFIKNNWKYILSFTVMVLLIILTIRTLFLQMDLEQFKDCLRRADLRYLAGAVVLVFIFIYAEGAAFRVVLKGLGRRISRKAGFVYSSVDIYFSYITPSATGGQPLMMYYMSKDKIHPSKSGLAILMYTSFYSITLVILGILAFLFYHPYLFTLKKGFILLYFMGMILCLFLGIICLLGMFSGRLLKRVGVGLINSLNKMRIIKNKEKKTRALLKALRDYHKGAEFIKKNPKISIQAFCWVMLQRIAALSTAYFVCHSFGIFDCSFFQLLCLQAFWTVASYVIPIPGAVGASEKMFLVLFASVFGEQLLLPGLFLTRGINFYLSLVICALVTIANQFRLVRREKQKLRTKQ